MTEQAYYPEEDWPAGERFCRCLGIKANQGRREGETFSLPRTALAYLARKPWYWYRLFPALDEYWLCKHFIRMINWEADKYRNEKNAGLADSIVRQARQNLDRESPKDWPELGGLAVQKLAHLRYYEELKDKQA